MGSEKTATRRRYGADAKAQVLAECDVPGASVAKVAMAHGINANVVHRWRQLAREGEVAAQAVNAEFVPVALPAQPDPTPIGDIRVELRRGAVAMTVVWPVSAATEFAGWMRELLR
jgi:transposase